MQISTYLQNPVFYILMIVGFFFSLAVHEFAHAYVAYRLGDYTAKAEGRLTLNPLKHIDPIGLLAMILFKVGWARPVPINPYNFKNPTRDMALVAIAGPLSNLIVAYISLFVSSILTIFGINGVFLSLFISLGFVNTMLAVFNLLPIPPLDGYRFLFLLVPVSLKYTLERFEYLGPFVLGIFLFVLDGGRYVLILTQLVLTGMLKYMILPVINLFKIIVSF